MFLVKLLRQFRELVSLEIRVCLAACCGLGVDDLAHSELIDLGLTDTLQAQSHDVAGASYYGNLCETVVAPGLVRVLM